MELLTIREKEKICEQERVAGSDGNPLWISLCSAVLALGRLYDFRRNLMALHRDDTGQIDISHTLGIGEGKSQGSLCICGVIDEERRACGGIPVIPGSSHGSI